MHGETMRNHVLFTAHMYKP